MKTTNYSGFMQLGSRICERRARASLSWRARSDQGFTLIELLVVIAIIALLASIVFAALSSAKQKARDANRIATARSLATALALYEDKNGSVIGINGISGGSGFSMGAISATTSTSLITTLVNGGFLSRQVASDSVFGADEYYLGIASDGRYQVFAKLERPENSMASSTLSSLPSGSGALSSGYNYGFAAGAGAGSGGVVASSTQGGGGGPTSPTAFALTQTTNNRIFTVGWTAGSGNGGASGCTIQYQADASWVAVSLPASVNCDASQAGLSVTLPGGTLTGVSGDWNARKLRMVRISDSTVVATSTNALACSSTAGSAGSTPNVDENCNGQWDDSTSSGGACYTCSATTWSYNYTETDYNATVCGGGVYGTSGSSIGGFNDSTSCNNDRASRFTGACYNTGGAGPYYSYRYTTSSCTSSTGSVTDCSICGSSPVTTTYY